MLIYVDNHWSLGVALFSANLPRFTNIYQHLELQITRSLFDLRPSFSPSVPRPYFSPLGSDSQGKHQQKSWCLKHQRMDFPEKKSRKIPGKWVLFMFFLAKSAQCGHFPRLQGDPNTWLHVQLDTASDDLRRKGLVFQWRAKIFKANYVNLCQLTGAKT